VVAFLAVILKEFRLLSRDPITVGLLLFMPFVLVAVLSTAFESLVVGRPPLELSVIDLDRTPASQALVERVDAGEAFDVTVEETDRQDVRQEDIDNLLGDDDGFAVLVIPAGYGDALDAGAETVLTLHGDPARASYVEVAREGVQGTLVVEELQDSLAELIAEEGGATAEEAQELVMEASAGGVEGVSRGLELVPVSERETFPSAYEQTVPGFAVMFGFFVAYAIAMNVYWEREEFGTWNRMLAAPLPYVAMTLARVLAYGLLGIAQLAVILVLGRLIWGMELGDDPLALLLTIGCWSLVCAAFGAVFATLIEDGPALSAVVSILVIILGAISGALIPFAFLPGWLQAAGYATPHFWAVDAIQDVIARGKGLEDVVIQLLVLAGFAAVLLALAFRPRAAVG
jgi:ABC-2 type transport system permease protein